MDSRPLRSCARVMGLVHVIVLGRGVIAARTWKVIEAVGLSWMELQSYVHVNLITSRE